MSDAVTVAAIAAVASVLSTIIGTRAAVMAKKAVTNTNPISNGFAKGVTTSLAHINAHLEDVHRDVRELRQALLGHLEGHS